jgi:hypothetical protein
MPPPCYFFLTQFAIQRPAPDIFLKRPYLCCLGNEIIFRAQARRAYRSRDWHAAKWQIDIFEMQKLLSMATIKMGALDRWL